MRDHQTAQTKRSKRIRRQWIVALILAGSPCFAQQPQINGLGSLPPLPLNAATVTPGVRSNPFCEPENEPSRSAVQQTTGSSPASHSVLLSPIGAAIGLNPVGAEQTPIGTAGRGPIMTIEPAHESAVQINPLIQSTHHRNRDLVDAKLGPALPVSHATPEQKTANPPRVRKASEAAIVLLNPAPKSLLVVPAQSPPVVTPADTSEPQVLAAKDTTPLTSVPKSAVAHSGSRATPPAIAAKTSPKPVVTTAKPEAKTKTADTKTAGASIASMLSQTPRGNAGDSKDGEAAPIFFSLSDESEIAPTQDALPNSKMDSLPKLSTTKRKTDQPSLPAPVTVKADGTVVTAPRPKPRKAQPKKSPIPAPILAEKNKPGAGLGLPSPITSPKEVSEPTRMPKLPTTAKRITPNGKSILSSAAPSSSEQPDKLSIATVNKFKPRDNSNSVKSISPAKPFSVSGEKSPSAVKAKSSKGPLSILAKSPSVKKQVASADSGSSKLTLPTPINVPGRIANADSNKKAGRAVIKVERPSPKKNARTNPHAETAKADTRKELVNPFNKQQTTRTSPTITQPEIPETVELKQAVRVEKYKINKDRPRVKVNLDSTADTSQRADKNPIASGVVAPISLPGSAVVEKATTSLAKTKPASETSSAKPEQQPSAKEPTGKAALAANNQPATQSPIQPTDVDGQTGKDGAVSGTTILRKRYRPPVAVQTVPGAVKRQATVASNDSTKVQAVQEMVLGNRKPQPPTVDLQQAMRLDTASELKDKSLNLGPDIKLTALHMNQAQVRSLTLGGSVRGVRVGDKGVCQAFASGPNQLKLIGTGIGTTRLVVWAQTGGDKDEVLMRAFEIHVNEVVPTEGNSIESTTELLNQSIQKVFPNSQAKVQLVRGELWVTGSCESQDSAERIIRMVRKSCLIPVRDQLTVK